ncbi:hypothetical protein ACPYPG_08290 [Streptomyces sp. FR-108]|uniref:hypothetical protein n=1 Tax=Streptomyces sp. FR-108 TaxID=3416665 RepID=UPI003CECD954
MSDTKANRSFRCDKWMSAGIHELAHRKDISDSEWLRRAVIDALSREGYNPSDYFDRLTPTK